MVRKKVTATTSETLVEAVPAQSRLTSGGRTLVFISHDSRDADLAEAFANLLSDVSAGTLKSFRSSDKKGSSGIEFGTEWYKAIMSQLGDATDVVALLTQRSTDRPWILYEAGVAKGKLDTNVLGIALGVPLEKVSSGPFGQFQNCGDDEDSLTKLVIQLLGRNPDASPREEAVRMQVRVFLEGIKKLISAKGDPAKSAAADENSVAKLFEEVKVMVRELPERVDDRVRSASRRGSLKRGRRFHPMMVEELLFHPTHSKTRGGTAAAWLLFISAVRDDIPWLYDVGLDLYRAMRTGDIRAIAEARNNLTEVLELSSEGPFMHEFMRGDDEEAFFVMRRIPEMLDRFLDGYDPKLRPRGRPKMMDEANQKDSSS